MERKTSSLLTSGPIDRRTCRLGERFFFVRVHDRAIARLRTTREPGICHFAPSIRVPAAFPINIVVTPADSAPYIWCSWLRVTLLNALDNLAVLDERIVKHIDLIRSPCRRDAEETSRVGPTDSQARDTLFPSAEHSSICALRSGMPLRTVLSEVIASCRLTQPSVKPTQISR